MTIESSLFQTSHPLLSFVIKWSSCIQIRMCLPIWWLLQNQVVLFGQTRFRLTLSIRDQHWEGTSSEKEQVKRKDAYVELKPSGRATESRCQLKRSRCTKGQERSIRWDGYSIIAVDNSLPTKGRKKASFFLECKTRKRRRNICTEVFGPWEEPKKRSRPFQRTNPSKRRRRP